MAKMLLTLLYGVRVSYSFSLIRPMNRLCLNNALLRVLDWLA